MIKAFEHIQFCCKKVAVTKQEDFSMVFGIFIADSVQVFVQVFSHRDQLPKCQIFTKLY